MKMWIICLSIVSIKIVSCFDLIINDQKKFSNYTTMLIPVGQRLNFFLKTPFKIDAFRVNIDTFTNITDLDKIKDYTLNDISLQKKYSNIPDFCFYSPIYPYISPILKIKENPFLGTEFVVSKDDYIFLLDENNILLGSKLKSLDPPGPIPPLFSDVPEIRQPSEDFFPSDLGEFSKTILTDDQNVRKELIPTKMFYDKEKDRLQVKVMRKLYYIDISIPSKPVKIADIPLDFNETSFIGFSHDCLFITGYNSEIEIHCVNKDFIISLSRTLKADEIFRSVTNDTYFPVFMDIQISDDYLLILDKNFGLLVMNISNPINPSYISNIPLVNGLYVRRQHESIVILKSQLSEGILTDSFLKGNFGIKLQEYKIDSSQSKFDYLLVREIYLGTRPVRMIEMTTNYVVIIRPNSLSLYLHSVPAEYTNLEMDILSEYMFDDYQTIKSARVDIDNNILLVGFMPNNFYLMNIQVRDIPIVCQMEKQHEGKDFFIQVSILGKDCLNDTLLRQDKFFDDICTFRTGFIARSNITQEEGLLSSFDDDEKEKLGLGLGLFFGILVLIIIIFIFNWKRLKAKLDELKHKKDQYGRIIEEDKKRKVDLSVTQLKDASTVI